MSRSRPKPSNAQQRDAELARSEAELKAGQEQLAAIKAEIGRSYQLLAGLQWRPEGGEPDPEQLMDGVVAPAPKFQRRR